MAQGGRMAGGLCSIAGLLDLSELGEKFGFS